MMTYNHRLLLRKLALRSKYEQQLQFPSVAASASHRHLSTKTNPKQRIRRSVHFVPADNDKFLSKSLSLGADTIVLDLEDSVKDKQLGRTKLQSFLQSSSSSVGRDATEVLVRINPLSGSVDEFGREMWRDDIQAGFEGADGFMVPKVESKDELMLLDEI